MDLIDRYLHAVRTFLPADQQNDIVSELSEDLAAKAADRQEELGRPLTVDEQAALLKPYGHPMLLASRYQSSQHLIGPTVFPFYRRILKLALITALVVHVVTALVLTATGSPLTRAIGVLWNYASTAIIVLGWVTVTFVLVDRFLPRLPFIDKWNPRSLPAVPAERAMVPRVNSAMELVATAAATCWWMANLHAQWLVLGPAASFLALGPGWQAAYVPILAILLGSLVLLTLDLVRPHRTKPRLVARIVMRAAAIVVCLVLLHIGQFVVFTPGAAADPSQVKILDVVNATFQIGLVIAAVITAFEVAGDVLRLRRIALPQMPSVV
jgi:hypothetical protein